MGLRIKELCKEKHITMIEIADRIGINAVTLSQSLNGNPTLSRLQQVADVLGVSVPDLFVKPDSKSIFGCLYVNGAPHIVNNKDDVLNLLKEIE